MPLFPLAISLYSIQDGVLLAIGGSSPHIHIYTSPSNTTNFTPAAVLKGHEDWIRGLHFTASKSDVYLASASQDRYVRLWRIFQTTSLLTQTSTDALSLSTLTHH